MIFHRYFLEPARFTGDSLMWIAKINQTIDEYVRQGMKLSVRQIYYQMVAKYNYPNKVSSYKKIVNLITKARMDGKIAWDAIEDRNRTLYGMKYCEHYPSILSDLEFEYKVDLWERQNHHVEVWVEKDALRGVVQRPASEWHLNYMACKGYLSATKAWEAGNRFRRYMKQGKQCVLIHLGDHDPSGIDMTRDNEDRLRTFAASGVDVQRIALNMDQIEEYNPPPDPAKITDSRYAGYRERFGDESWELDALEPLVLQNLITEKVQEYVDHDLWAEAKQEQAQKREVLEKLGENWQEVFWGLGFFPDGTPKAEDDYRGFSELDDHEL